MSYKKFQEKKYDFLTEWKEKYNAKENERICQYRSYQLIQNENKNKIKELKEENENLYQFIANKTQKCNKGHLKHILNFTKEIPDEKNFLNRVDMPKTNNLVCENFLREITKLNCILYERKELCNDVEHVYYLKKRLKHEIKLVKDEKKVDTIQRQIRENQSYFEKVKVKYETACYMNKILRQIKKEFVDSKEQASKEIDKIREMLLAKVQEKNSLKSELNENIEKRDTVKLQVAKLEKELLERKHKREEYAAIMQQVLEEVKIIEIDQSKIKTENDKNLCYEQLLATKVAEEANLRKEEFKFNFLNNFYSNHLKLKTITTSIKYEDSVNEVKKLNEKNVKFLNLIDALFAQKCALENELDAIKSEYFKQLDLSDESIEKKDGFMTIESLNEENLKLVDLAYNFTFINEYKNGYLNEFLISIAGLCAKMINFKILNDELFKTADQLDNLKNKLNTEQLSNIRDSKNSSLPKTPKDVLTQLDVISDISSFLCENIPHQSNIEAHFYVNEMNKLVNFMQNAYAIVKQEDDSQSSDFSEEVYSFDDLNEYVSREKIKMRTQDILNRKSKMKNTAKMFATMKSISAVAK